MLDRSRRYRDDEEEEDRGTVTIRRAGMEPRDQGQRDVDRKTELIRSETRPEEARSADETVILRAGKEPSILAWLIEKEGRRPGTAYRLNEDITSIGRHSENNIVLDDPAVSREHTKIRVEEGKFMLYDLVSENGTFVNGERVANKEMAENDEITIGESVLVFKKI